MLTKFPLLFLLLTSSVWGQSSSFEYKAEDSSDSGVRFALETADHYYIAILFNLEDGQQYADQYILKLTPSGEVESQLVLLPPAPGITYDQIIALNNGYLLIGKSESYPFSSTIYLRKLDPNFEMVSEETIETNLPPSSSLPIFIQLKKVGDRFYLLATALGTIKNYIGILNEEGTLIGTSGILGDNFCNSAWDLTVSPQTKAVFCVSTGLLCLTDSSFTPLPYIDCPVNMQSSIAIAEQTGAIYVAGRGKSSNESTTILLKYDQEMSLHSQLIIGQPGGAELIHPAFRTALALGEDGSVFAGGTWNSQLFTDYPEENAYFFLTKTDSDLSIQWTHKYGGEAYYAMKGLFQTSDGGILMYGYRYDESTTSGWDAYILKTDSAGQTSGTSQPSETNSDFYLYPNPAKGYTSMNSQGNNLEQIVFYSLDGKDKYTHSSSMPSKFSVSDWVPGIYIYHVLSPDGQICSRGKFIKL